MTAETKQPKTKRVRPTAHFLFPDEINIVFTKMSDSDCIWHNVPAGSYHGYTANYGWFPTSLVAGVVNHRFDPNTELSKHSGYIDSCNLGTMGHAFLHIDNAIKILTDKGYNVWVE